MTIGGGLYTVGIEEGRGVVGERVGSGVAAAVGEVVVGEVVGFAVWSGAVGA